MKKFLMTIAALSVLTLGAMADSPWEELKADFQKATNAVKSDADNVNAQQKRGAESEFSIQSDIDKVIAKRDKELAGINKKIQTKTSELMRAKVNFKLTQSQRDAQVSALEKQIKTLKAQKERVTELYRQEIRDMRQVN